MRPEDFYTKPACNTPQRLALFLPSGEKTEHWIEVYGIDSDAYEAVLAETQQQLLAIEVVAHAHKAAALEDSEQIEQTISKLQRVSSDRQALLKGRELITKAALVAGWSFDAPCTQEAVMELLKNSPQIAQALDVFCSNRQNFLKKKLTA